MALRCICPSLICSRSPLQHRCPMALSIRLSIRFDRLQCRPAESQAWTFHTGDMYVGLERRVARQGLGLRIHPALCRRNPLRHHRLRTRHRPRPRNRKQKWAFDPQIDRGGGYGDFANRGVSPGSTPPPKSAPSSSPPSTRACSRSTRQPESPCPALANDGQIDLKKGLRLPGAKRRRIRRDFAARPSSEIWWWWVRPSRTTAAPICRAAKFAPTMSAPATALDLRPHARDPNRGGQRMVRSSRPTPRTTCSSCPPPVPAPITMAASARATTYANSVVALNAKTGARGLALPNRASRPLGLRCRRAARP